MTTKKIKNKKMGERKNKSPKTTKATIRSPKKISKSKAKSKTKTKAKNKTIGLIESKGRYIAISALLLIAIVALVFVALGLMKKRVEPVFPSPSLTGIPIDTPKGVLKTERDIIAVNEEITRSLLELGFFESSLKDADEELRVSGGVHFKEIAESYILKDGDDKKEIVKFLHGGLKSFGDDVTIDETELSDGGLRLIFYLQNHPVRRLTFFSLAPNAPKDLKITKPPVERRLPRLVIIMDDMGTNKKYLRELLALKYPVTISVMPHQPYSKYVAKRAHKKGAEVMLHLPMEPIGYPNKNPGAGALFTFMEDEMFKNSLISAIDSVPNIVGVNNHMGSRLTQDEAKMKLVLTELKKRGLFFVDSRTTAKTKAYELAIKMGVPTVERSVFLDNECDVRKIKERIRELIKRAKENDGAVGICHPKPETIEALKLMEPTLTSGNVEVVTVGEFLKQK
jgi:polysaccharide deacetylase 2 family uncharacterized protein YibQ